MIEYPTKILLATDGAEDSVRVALVAISLADRAGGELHVIHVGRSPAASRGTAMRPALPGEPPGYSEREARKLLDRETARVREAGGKVAEAHLRVGEPAGEVIAASAELGADMLVVGGGRPRAARRAGAAAIRRPAIGRAADAIIRTAPCPVLVVRGDTVPGEDEEVER
jgi:nucleotide-binding universal stress UspA family protein